MVVIIIRTMRVSFPHVLGIINSTFDRQVYGADISLWQESLAGLDYASIIVDDKISHFGYEIDTADEGVFLTDVDFPKRIITCFADFILSN